MKRHVAAAVVLVTAFLVVDSHVDWVRLDGRHLLEVSGQRLDALGWAADRVLHLRRDCAQTMDLAPDSAVARDMLQVIQKHSLPDSQSARWLQLQRLDDWALAEVAFDTLKPTVVALRLQAGQWRVQDQAVWSGSTAPWHSGDFVRRYLRQQAPDLPRPLVQCLQVDPTRYSPGPGGLGPMAGPASTEAVASSGFISAGFSAAYFLSANFSTADSLTANLATTSPASAGLATAQALAAAVFAGGPP